MVSYSVRKTLNSPRFYIVEIAQRIVYTGREKEWISNHDSGINFSMCVDKIDENEVNQKICK